MQYKLKIYFATEMGHEFVLVCPIGSNASSTLQVLWPGPALSALRSSGKGVAGKDTWPQPSIASGTCVTVGNYWTPRALASSSGKWKLSKWLDKTMSNPEFFFHYHQEKVESRETMAQQVADFPVEILPVTSDSGTKGKSQNLLRVSMVSGSSSVGRR